MGILEIQIIDGQVKQAVASGSPHCYLAFHNSDKQSGQYPGIRSMLLSSARRKLVVSRQSIPLPSEF